TAACCSPMARSLPRRESIRSVRPAAAPRGNAGRCAASASDRAAPDARSSGGETSIDRVHGTAHVARRIAQEECRELPDLVGGRESPQRNFCQNLFLGQL